MSRSKNVFLLLALACLGSYASSWPEFRGPRRSGVATAISDELPLQFGPGTNEVWSLAVPAGHSSPVLWAEQIFLTAFDDGRLVTLAVGREDGREQWRRAVEPGTIESGSRLSHPATATAATDGTRLIVYFAPFGLLAYDLSGSELWRHPMPTPLTQHGASSSPVLAGDVVIQVCDQDLDSYLIALDKQTGAVRWRVERPQFRRGFSTPLPWPVDRPQSIILAGTLRLVSYRLADGSEEWSARGLPNEMVASPIAGNGLVIVAGWTYGSGVARMPLWSSFFPDHDRDQDGRLTRDEAPAGPAKQHFAYIDANKDAHLTADEYETIAEIFNASSNVVMAVRPGGNGEVSMTHVAWRQTRGLPYVPTPLYHQGRVYLVRNGGLVSCLNSSTGEYIYREERLGAVGDYYSSPVAAGEKVLAISQAGVAVVFRGGDTLEVLGRNPIGEEVLATPAIADGTLFIRSRSRLRAFRTPPLASTE